MMEADPQPRGPEGRVDGAPAAMDDLALRPTQRVIAAIGVAGLLATGLQEPGKQVLVVGIWLCRKGCMATSSAGTADSESQ
jgi:hypothetical protein